MRRNSNEGLEGLHGGVLGLGQADEAARRKQAPKVAAAPLLQLSKGRG